MPPSRPPAVSVLAIANATNASKLQTLGDVEKYWCFGIRETTGISISPGRCYVVIEVYSADPIANAKAIGCPLGFYFVGQSSNESVPWKTVGGFPFKLPAGSAFRVRVASGSGVAGTENFEGWALECEAPPNPFIEPLFTGQGDQQITSFSNPSAGADISLSYAGKVHFQFATFYATLVTAAGGGNRQVIMQRQGSAGTMQAESGLGPVQAGSLTNVYIWEEGWPLNAGIENTRSHLPASNRTRRAGSSDKFVTSTLNLAGTDQWSAIKVVTEEWATVAV